MTTQNSINSPRPFAVNIGGTGLATLTAHGILVGEGTGNVNPIVLTNGQLLIGNTGSDPSAATLSAGAGIAITNGGGTITIAATSAGFTWTTVSGTTQAIAAQNGYIANNAGLVTLTLPATGTVGDTFIVTGLGAGGWLIAQNASQLIHFGNVVTTTGAGGSLASSNQYDTVEIVCIVTNTTWAVLNAVGNITYV